MFMIGEEIPYIVTEATMILPGDHICVIKDDGTVGIRYLLPGIYNAGSTVPETELPNPLPCPEAAGPGWREL